MSSDFTQPGVGTSNPPPLIGALLRVPFETVRIVPDGSQVANYGFDVTPARLVSGLITEHGVIPATRAALAQTFPERAAAVKSNAA